MISILDAGNDYSKMQRMGLPFTDSDSPQWYKVIVSSIWCNFLKEAGHFCTFEIWNRNVTIKHVHVFLFTDTLWQKRRERFYFKIPHRESEHSFQTSGCKLLISHLSCL